MPRSTEKRSELALPGIVHINETMSSSFLLKPEMLLLLNTYHICPLFENVWESPIQISALASHSDFPNRDGIEGRIHASSRDIAVFSVLIVSSQSSMSRKNAQRMQSVCHASIAMHIDFTYIWQIYVKFTLFLLNNAVLLTTLGFHIYSTSAF